MANATLLVQNNETTRELQTSEQYNFPGLASSIFIVSINVYSFGNCTTEI